VLAHFLGIGRGADLIFYLAILFFSFIIMKLPQSEGAGANANENHP